MKKLVLASSSRYRAELLSRLGLPFETCSPDIDESRRPGEEPEALVARLSEEKARAVAAGLPQGLVVGSDQVAVCEAEILGKPGTEDRARDQLSRLSGKVVRFHTGLCLLDAGTGESQTSVVTTTVAFRTLSQAEIHNYVAREQPLDCAGSFKSEALGIALFQAIEGPDPNALVGLPLIELCRMLRRAGLDVLADDHQRNAAHAS